MGWCRAAEVRVGSGKSFKYLILKRGKKWLDGRGFPFCNRLRIGGWLISHIHNLIAAQVKLDERRFRRAGKSLTTIAAQ
jgi:hypothetical protein